LLAIAACPARAVFAQSGSKLILNLGMHDSVFWSVGDPIDLTATATWDL